MSAAPRRPGDKLAILVNANAKRGGRRIAVQIAQRLPGANVRLTKSAAEIAGWLATLDDARCILVAGGDGTAVGAINAIDRAVPRDRPFPTIGLLPLGTGNGWARSNGAPKLDRCLRILADAYGKLPTRRYGIFECDGTLAHFGGSGWDAMIIEDYKQQLENSVPPTTIFTKSVYGYLTATFTRTVPKITLLGNPHVIIENLGDEVYTLTADGKILRMHGAVRGSVIYDGSAGVSSVGTSPEYGYGFRAFPFAERMPGYMNVRIYDRHPLAGVVNIPKLWTGKHPIQGMHDWFAKAIRMTFSRPVPLQIGGDAHGMRQSVEYRISERTVDMVDWRRLL